MEKREKLEGLVLKIHLLTEGMDEKDFQKKFGKGQAVGFLYHIAFLCDLYQCESE